MADNEQNGSSMLEEGNGSDVNGGTGSTGTTAETTGTTTGGTGVDNGATTTGGQQTSASGVLENYQPFSVGEGNQPLDQETHNTLTAFGKEMKLTQEQMQKLVTLGVNKFTDGQEALRLEIKKQYDKWAETSTNDPEIKSELDAEGRVKGSKELINRIMGNADEATEFRKMAQETGIGVNPLFIKFCIRTGKLLGEAPFLESSKVEGTKGSVMSLREQARQVYPNMI